MHARGSRAEARGSLYFILVAVVVSSFIAHGHADMVVVVVVVVRRRDEMRGGP